MWQHRPEQGSKEQPFPLTSLGAGSEPPSRAAPLTAELHFQIFCFLPLFILPLSKQDKIIHLKPDSLPREVKGSFCVKFNGHLIRTLGCGKHENFPSCILPHKSVSNFFLVQF